MAKNKKPKYGAGQVVQGEILPTLVVDWSDCISNPEEWTRGAALPVGAVEPPATKKRASRRRPKR